MTDRELLEAAAKAAGSDLKWGTSFIVGDDAVDCTNLAEVDGGPWDPLWDDGDALRLAVKLNIDIGHGIGERWACYFADSKVFREPIGTDATAATRRAIVRAAASMSPDLAAGGREGVR